MNFKQEEINYKFRPTDFIPFYGMYLWGKRSREEYENNGMNLTNHLAVRSVFMAMYNGTVCSIIIGNSLISLLEKIIK